jgi:lipopolysaccharide/colanic/teichoic acid biosynthesis glycosyltransferase
MYRRYGKRTLDLMASTVALILLSPLIGAMAVLVRLRLGTPILFRQQRPGLRGRPFVIYKFRTMTDRRDEDGDLLPDADRLTDFG